MNIRNNIIELLKGVKIEWMALGEVSEVGTGNANRQDEDENGEYPFYVRSKNILKSKKYQFDETAIVLPGEGGIGDIFHYIEGKYALHQRAYRIHVYSNKINTKFLYYLMCDKFKKYILTRCVGATSISIRKPMLEQFQFPVPPLHVQTEIVRILDTFTELTAELTAELTTRQKQYNYYRDKLLSFKEDEVEWKTLGEICSISVGHLPSNYIKGKYAFVNAGTTPSDYLSIYNTDEETITTPSRGQGGIGYVGYQHNRFWCGPLSYRIRSINDEVITRFVYYVMSNVPHKIINLANMVGIPALNRKELINFSIPIPPLEEQTRVVEILDKFDAITNSLSEGLPREIELRQKQYEYYRNLLLNFPKVEDK